MCYAIPAKIIEIKRDEDNNSNILGIVDYGGIIKQINLSLIENPNVDDYILIHAGFGIEKLDKRSAEESLQIIRNQINETEKIFNNEN